MITVNDVIERFIGCFNSKNFNREFLNLFDKKFLIIEGDNIYTKGNDILQFLNKFMLVNQNIKSSILNFYENKYQYFASILIENECKEEVIKYVFDLIFKKNEGRFLIVLLNIIKLS